MLHHNVNHDHNAHAACTWMSFFRLMLLDGHASDHFLPLKSDTQEDSIDTCIHVLSLGPTIYCVLACIKSSPNCQLTPSNFSIPIICDVEAKGLWFCRSLEVNVSVELAERYGISAHDNNNAMQVTSI